jgi:glutamine amidotransferase|tara:strand:+ start:168 stop:770 length:603 start_codon:yes stop_codon:yes gene_type:complete
MSGSLAIIDGGGANIASLTFALQRLGVTAQLTTDKSAIARADKVILPGVGAAADAMTRLQHADLCQFIRDLKQPVLGICLGMQLMFDTSEEDDATCLGIIPGKATRFTPAPNRPVPHMGWNKVQQKSASPIFAGIEDNPYFYFVHSFALPISEDTIGSTDYGSEFTAVAESNNFVAAQFHPERSGAVGARFLKNFISNYN